MSDKLSGMSDHGSGVEFLETEARRGASRRVEAHRGVEASSFTQQHIITPSNGIEASSFGVEASRLASSLDVEASRPGLS